MQWINWYIELQSNRSGGNKKQSTKIDGWMAMKSDSETEHRKYEGRPINKLQDGIILLIFKIWKIRNVGFVGNVILNNRCEFYYDDSHCDVIC